MTLGGTTLMAHLTPGHTKGCTTWTMKAQEGGRSYDVVIIGTWASTPAPVSSTTPATRPSPTNTFRGSRSCMRCRAMFRSDPTPTWYNMAEKHAKLGDGRPNPFIDPQGYKAELDLVERTFRSVLDDQNKAAAQ